jgi:hypothetical protein
MTPNDAESLLAKHPEYPAARIRLHERNQELIKAAPQRSNDIGTEERISFLIAQFDNFAQEYLRLVSDMDSQGAFETLLNSAARSKWQFFTGHHFQDAPPSVYPGEWARLFTRLQHWTTEGYRKIDAPAPPPPESQKQDQQARSISPAAKKKTRHFQEPNLELLKKE